MGKASISSGSIKTYSTRKYKEVIPLTAFSACFSNCFGVSITYFPDINHDRFNFLKFSVQTGEISCHLMNYYRQTIFKKLLFIHTVCQKKGTLTNFAEISPLGDLSIGNVLFFHVWKNCVVGEMLPFFQTESQRY